MREYQLGNVEHRDFQHDHSTEAKPVSLSRKERRRWCKGKEGVAHQTVCRPYDEVKGLKGVFWSSNNWRVLYCKACGKELAYWMPLIYENGSTHQKTPPSWVDC